MAVSQAAMRRRTRIMRAVNVPMRAALSLPFATPLSGNLMLISHIGRKTGKHYRQPVSYVRDMTTPLLILHSEDDLRCPIEQAEQLFVQLRRMAKVEVDMVRFPEESHNLSRSGRPDRRIERLERIVGWFDRHMK